MVGIAHATEKRGRGGYEGGKKAKGAARAVFSAAGGGAAGRADGVDARAAATCRYQRATGYGGAAGDGAGGGGGCCVFRDAGIDVVFHAAGIVEDGWDGGGDAAVGGNQR